MLRRGSREVQIVRDRELGHLRANRRKGSVFPRVHRTGCGRERKDGRDDREGNKSAERGGRGRFRSHEIVNSAVWEPIGGRGVCSHECIATGNPPMSPRVEGGAISRLEYRRTVQIAHGSVWRAGIGAMIEGARHQRRRAQFSRMLRFSR